MKVYIAAPFFKPDQLKLVKKLESSLTKANIDFYSPRSEGVIKDMTPEEKKLRSAFIYGTNVSQINECSHMVAVIDDYDVGTMFEFGYAAAKAKPIYTLSNQGHKLNVMLMHAARGHYDSVQNVVATLLGQFAKPADAEAVT